MHDMGSCKELLNSPRFLGFPRAVQSLRFGGSQAAMCWLAGLDDGDDLKPWATLGAPLRTQETSKRP